MLNAEEVKSMMIAVADAVIDNEKALSDADRQLGDGDHGLGMKRGFTEARKQLEALAPSSVSQVFTTTGMALMVGEGGHAAYAKTLRACGEHLLLDPP